MASSGKKGKKTKGKTLALNEFLANKNESEPIKPPWKPSWADEEAEDDYSHRSSKDKTVLLPTAPRATREPGVIDESRIPNEAPYIAYISNLPYEVDNEDIADFFKGLEIKNLRLPRDEGREGSKLKGFGYVEFEDRDSLRDALHFANRDIKGRVVGVEVADGGDDRYRRGGMGRDMRRGMGRDMDGPDRTLGDWRSGPREEDREMERERGFGFRDRGTGGRRDFGVGFRERDGGGFREREGGGGFRDGGGYREGGGFRDGGGIREREGGFRERGEGGYSDRWGGDRDYMRRDGGEMTRREGGDMTRREGGYPRRGLEDREEGPERDMNRTRPKLQLAPRTKPPEEKKPDAAPVVAPSSIFGGAKPVDTAAREREIEERLARERGSNDAPITRDPEAKQKGGSDTSEEEGKVRRENVWSRRAQRSSEDNREDGDQGEVNRERGRLETEPEPRSVPTHGQVYSSKDAANVSSSKEKHESSAKTKPHQGAPRNPLKMPELIDEGPPSFVGTNKFASLPDEEIAENSE